MWLEELQLRDFRGFRALKLDLRRRLTVVIGVNGAGKTSLVEALEIAATQAVAVTFGHDHAIEPTDHDIRIGQHDCEIQLEFDGTKLRIQRGRGAISAVNSSPKFETPPLVIMFKSDRAVLKRPRVTHAGSPAKATSSTSHPAWDDDLDAGFTSFEHGERWFRDREDLENQERVRRKQLDYVDHGLDQARRAIEAMLPRYRDPRIDRSRPLGPPQSQLVLNKGDDELTADMLSDGERSLLVIAMTIARRLSQLDPEIASSPQAATVVIDEVELHLHPKWQRAIVPSLLRAFPACQFIVTTHSPQVIGSISHSSVLILEDFALYSSSIPTHGRDSNAILEEIMGAPERDDASQEQLRKIARLLDDGELDAARPAIDELADRWGEDDREVIRLRTALEFREL